MGRAWSQTYREYAVFKKIESLFGLDWGSSDLHSLLLSVQLLCSQSFEYSDGFSSAEEDSEAPVCFFFF